MRVCSSSSRAQGLSLIAGFVPRALTEVATSQGLGLDLQETPCWSDSVRFLTTMRTGAS
jgi:hypothetical protein